MRNAKVGKRELQNGADQAREVEKTTASLGDIVVGSDLGESDCRVEKAGIGDGEAKPVDRLARAAERNGGARA